MKCVHCGSKMKCKLGTHHYTESGLDNFYISGIQICTCSCGEEIVSIPKIAELHDLIGRILIKKHAPLTGKEIRFLRKNMGLTATKLAEYIAVDIATISRWEKDVNRSPDPSNDRLLRLLYCSIKEIPQTKSLVEKDFAGIAKQIGIPPAFTIPVKDWSESNQCSVCEE